MLLAAHFTCAYCGVLVETSVDISAGVGQRYVEDCEVCCRPNVLDITVLDAEGPASITATFEE